MEESKHKQLRNSGQQYVSSAGRIVSAKKFAGLKTIIATKHILINFLTFKQNRFSQIFGTLAISCFSSPCYAELVEKVWESR